MVSWYVVRITLWHLTFILGTFGEILYGAMKILAIRSEMVHDTHDPVLKLHFIEPPNRLEMGWGEKEVGVPV